MKRNKGFTLVELIAIIIIIGVVIGIISPVALKSIEKSKVNAYREGLRSIIRSTEIYMEENNLKTLPEEGISLDDNIIQVDNMNGYTGLVKYENGEIKLVNIGNGKYCGNGNRDTLSVTRYDESCIVESTNIGS